MVRIGQRLCKLVRIVGLLLIAIGGLYLGLIPNGQSSTDEANLAVGGQGPLPPAQHNPHDGRILQLAIGQRSAPAASHGASSSKELSPQQKPSRKDPNSKVMPLSPLRSQLKDTSWDADNAMSLPDKLASGSHPALPWPRRVNLMPNYFLNYNRSAPEEVTSSGAGDVLVFLHHNKAAGTSTKECLKKVVGASHRSLGNVLSNDGRLGILSNLRKLRRRGKAIPNTFFGGYAFGVCDELQRPCSYFTVLRDPYERSLSSHSYCKTARTDQLCTALFANKVTPREWALHQGSFFFRQLVFHPEFCSDRTKWIPFVDLEGEPHEFDGPQGSLHDATCWFRQKLIMSLTLSRSEHDALLKHCLDNLERWFKVIMLVDEFDLSLHMMEEAYKLPFHKLCSGQHANSGSYDKNYHNGSSSMPGASSPNVSSPGAVPLKVQFLRELKEDPEVRAALRADLAIYQRGVEIFEQQREVFMNIKPEKRN